MLCYVMLWHDVYNNRIAGVFIDTNQFLIGKILLKPLNAKIPDAICFALSIFLYYFMAWQTLLNIKDKTKNVALLLRIIQFQAYF
jgi:hypothetical protein